MTRKQQLRLPMIRIILLFSFLIALSVPAIAKDERGIAIKPTAPTGEKVKGEQWLLTIGIDSYLSWPRLKTATNDAKALKKVLLERYHVDQSRVIELYDENATRKNILGTLRDLTRKVKPEDSLLIYYAGHGHIDSITKKGSWIPVESGTDDPGAWISNQDIKDYLNIDAIKAKHVLLVSDSCFSGDFFRGTRGAIPDVTDTVIKKAYQLSSRQAITSGGLEPVSDAGFGGNSVFSHFLVAALKNNTNPYLIPSELFPSIKSGVAQNAEQFPQMGALYGVGGQDGGELVLFLKQEDRLGELYAGSAARQKELDLLRKAEAEAAEAKKKEQAEITKKQAELDSLDKQIAEMKGRLGSGSARSSDGLDALVVMAEQKTEQGKHLEELRRQREAEEQKRQNEIERLKREALEKRATRIIADISKYQKIADNQYTQDMKSAAWDALIATYPEAKGVQQFDVDAFLISQGLLIDNGNILTAQAKQDRERERQLSAAEEQKRAVVLERERLIYTDPITTLQWARNGNISGNKMNWNQAVSWVKNLNYADYNDWRLPTKDELASRMKRVGKHPSAWLNGHGYSNIQTGWYWSGTESYANDVWGIELGAVYVGKISSNSKDYNGYVWPVRSGQVGK